MKNIAKKAKAKTWQAVTLGVLVAVTFYKIIFALMKLACLTPEIYQTVTHDVFLQVFSIFFSIIVGALAYSLYSEAIFMNAKKYKRELLELRHKHLVKLIEKAIDNNDGVKAEKLYDQYIKTKTATLHNMGFLDGAIRAKFHNKLNITFED